MKRDATVPELPDILRLPRNKVLVPLAGAVVTLFAIPGAIYFFMGKIFSTILRKIILDRISEAFLPLMRKLVPIFYIDPKDTSPLQSFCLVAGVVYPILLWNLFSSFDFSLLCAIRVLSYATAIVYFNVDFEGLGLGHMEAHASWVKGGIVKPEWRWLFDRFAEHFFCPLAGITPGMPTYTHCLVHHKFGNNLEDPQSTFWFDRTSLVDFLFYYNPISLYNRHWSIGAIPKMLEYGQNKHAENMMNGINRFFLMVGTIALLNFRFFLFVFLPVALFNTLAISSAEWTMHAFLDLDNVKCTPVVATPALDTGAEKYRRDSYHMVHHALNTGYYSQENKMLEKAQFDSYQSGRDNQEDTLLYVFNFDKQYGHNNWTWVQLFFLLMKRDLKKLAEGFVWTGKGERPSEEEIISFLHRSTRPVDVTRYSMERWRAQQMVGPVDLKDKKSMKLQSDN